MNWIRIIRNALVVSVMAFILSSVIMLFLNTRVNWAQQGTTALLFFLGCSVIFFFQDRKAVKKAATHKEIPENHEQPEL
jgi:hypothetical protein